MGRGLQDQVGLHRTVRIVLVGTVGFGLLWGLLGGDARAERQPVYMHARGKAFLAPGEEELGEGPVGGGKFRRPAVPAGPMPSAAQLQPEPEATPLQPGPQADLPAGPRDSTPAFQLCTPKAPLDRWAVQRSMWPGSTLHVYEAEVLPGTPGAVPDVLSLLAVIEDETDSETHGIKQKHWNPLVMRRNYDHLVSKTACTFPGAAGSARSGARGVWFKEKGTILGLLIQCALPEGLATGSAASGFDVALEAAAGSRLALRMCPNSFASRRYGLALCTTHQFRGRLGPEVAKEWLEYHRLLGVDHIVFRDRVRPEGAWQHKAQPVGVGVHNATLRPYVEQGFVSYAPGPYHPPFDWGSVYSDQLYANTACYMRLRHAADWIVTNDLDEHVEIQNEGSDAPQWLPAYLAGQPSSVNEVALVHCRMMTLEANGDWTPLGRNPRDKPPRLVLDRPVHRNCRLDVPAGKSIGRVRETPFTHIHFTYQPTGHDTNEPACAWRWNSTAVPPGCNISADYPAKARESSGRSYNLYAGINHAGSKFLNWNGNQGVATRAFTNSSLNAELWKRMGW